MALMPVETAWAGIAASPFAHQKVPQFHARPVLGGRSSTKGRRIPARESNGGTRAESHQPKALGDNSGPPNSPETAFP